MTPFHALHLALEAEEGAFSFYSSIAEQTRDKAIRELADEFSAEEKQHAEALKKWINQFPEPPDSWDDDLDPPVSVD